MKKNILIFATSVLAVLIQTANAQQLSTIAGKWQRGVINDNTKVSLFEVKYGTINEISTSKVAKDGSFAFAINHQEPSYYVIGSTTKGMRDKYSFFFKPGDRLNVSINDSTYVLAGNNTKENIELEKWHNFMYDLEFTVLYKTLGTYVDYFPLLEDKLPEINAYKAAETGTPAFDKTFADVRKLDILANSLYLITSLRTAHPHPDDFPDYYLDLKLKDYTANNIIVNHPFGMLSIAGVEYVNQSLNTHRFSEEDLKLYRSPMTMIDFKLDQIVDSEVKGEYLINKVNIISSYEGYMNFCGKYEKYMANNDQKERLAAKSIKFGSKEVGAQAVNFTFPDINGKQVSLSDFKGKVVYIDVWATWCGPCQKEIPFLKELEKQYHGKDIVFLSVSTDAQKDYEKWKKMIADKEMTGVQLFAGDKSENISKPYEIKGIPRFIIVGKNGKIVSNNAPRPSSNEIKLVLDAALRAK